MISDIGRLVPAFETRVLSVLGALKGQGYKPTLHETYRDPARAAALVAAGKSKARGGLSMHCYGCAADVICGDHQWDCARHHCKFFDALGAQAEDMLLTWGGRWATLHDLPHIQAVPVSWQEKIRAAKPTEIDGLVQKYFAGR